MQPWRREVSVLARLSGPVIVAQVGGMLMGAVDLVLLGHYGAEALAAAAIGNVWVYGTLIVAEGLVRGIDPVVAQAHGAEDGARAGLALQQGLLLGWALCIPVAGLWLATEPVLLLSGQQPRIARLAHDYVLLQIPSIPFHLSWMALRGWLVGRGLTRPPMWVMLVANLWNGLLAWVLIFGRLGAPELGVAGAGLATCLARILNVAALLGLVLWLRLDEGAWRPWSREALRLAPLRPVLALGWPFAAQIGFEVWAFSLATLMAGNLGVEALAGHQITLNLASLSFMVPLGIAVGASARVGNLVGAGDAAGVQRAARVALGLAAAVMACFGATFVLGRAWLPALYTPDHGAIATCAWILPIAAAFQIFDGLQVVASGVLRGMGLPRAPALANAVGYYAIALPCGWWLTFQGEWGLAGVWWGLALGLAIVAGGLVIHVLRSGSGVRV